MSTLIFKCSAGVFVCVSQWYLFHFSVLWFPAVSGKVSWTRLMTNAAINTYCMYSGTAGLFVGQGSSFLIWMS